ncbi:MAG TPA: ABC transporter substrate-binding protein [Candidatus Limnocylindria bacterium]|nr:ABC transporter substrate-binding protein [Candidatus Limnocylindria bacterium]
MRTRLRVPVHFLLLAACLAACQPDGSAQHTSAAAATPTAEASPTPLPATRYPVTLTDDAGREVTIEAEPKRIVSLAPSNTEIACALGSCDELVGVPEYQVGYPDDVAETVADLPIVVSFGPVDREAIVAAEPDLILAAGNELTSSADIEALAELGYPVLALYPESLDEVVADIELVGAALNAPAETAAVTADMADRVAAVREAVAGAERPRVFYEVSIFEGTIYTAGEDSFLESLIDIAGGDPITGDATTTAIALEDLVTADPQVIVLGDAAYDSSITAESVQARQGWEDMTAVQDGRVLPLPEDILITRPGPRIVDGLEALARAIHPDAFS